MGSYFPHISRDHVVFILIQSIELLVFVYSTSGDLALCSHVIGDDMILTPPIKKLDTIEKLI